ALAGELDAVAPPAVGARLGDVPVRQALAHSVRSFVVTSESAATTAGAVTVPCSRRAVLVAAVTIELGTMRLTAVPVARRESVPSTHLRQVGAIGRHALGRQTAFWHAATTADVAVLCEPRLVARITFGRPILAGRTGPVVSGTGIAILAGFGNHTGTTGTRADAARAGAAGPHGLHPASAGGDAGGADGTHAVARRDGGSRAAARHRGRRVAARRTVPVGARGHRWARGDDVGTADPNRCAVRQIGGRARELVAATSGGSERRNARDHAGRKQCSARRTNMRRGRNPSHGFPIAVGRSRGPRHSLTILAARSGRANAPKVSSDPPGASEKPRTASEVERLVRTRCTFSWLPPLSLRGCKLEPPRRYCWTHDRHSDRHAEPAWASAGQYSGSWNSPGGSSAVGR